MSNEKGLWLEWLSVDDESDQEQAMSVGEVDALIEAWLMHNGVDNYTVGKSEVYTVFHSDLLDLIRKVRDAQREQDAGIVINFGEGAASKAIREGGE